LVCRGERRRGCGLGHRHRTAAGGRHADDLFTHTITHTITRSLSLSSLSWCPHLSPSHLISPHRPRLSRVCAGRLRCPGGVDQHPAAMRA
jgi:hypothetical protein